jgi:hypothetical protein
MHVLQPIQWNEPAEGDTLMTRVAARFADLFPYSRKNSFTTDAEAQAQVDQMLNEMDIKSSPKSKHRQHEKKAPSIHPRTLSAHEPKVIQVLSRITYPLAYQMAQLVDGNVELLRSSLTYVFNHVDALAKSFPLDESEHASGVDALSISQFYHQVLEDLEIHYDGFIRIVLEGCNNTVTTLLRQGSGREQSISSDKELRAVWIILQASLHGVPYMW